MSKSPKKHQALRGPETIVLLLLISNLLLMIPIIGKYSYRKIPEWYDKKMITRLGGTTTTGSSSRKSSGRPKKRIFAGTRFHELKKQKRMELGVDERIREIIEKEIINIKTKLKKQLSQELKHPNGMDIVDKLKRTMTRLRFHVGNRDSDSRLAPLSQIFPAVFDSFQNGTDVIIDYDPIDQDNQTIQSVDVNDTDNGKNHERTVLNKMTDVLVDDGLEADEECRAVEEINSIYARHCDCRCPRMEDGEAKSAYDNIVKFCEETDFSISEATKTWVESFSPCYQGLRSLNMRIREIEQLKDALRALQQNSNKQYEDIIELMKIPYKIKLLIWSQLGIHMDTSHHHESEVRSRFEGLFNKFDKDMQKKQDSICDICAMMSDHCDFQKFRKGLVNSILDVPCISCSRRYDCADCLETELSACRICQRPLRKGKVPPLSQTNGLEFFRSPPPELQNLNFIERSLIQKARVLQTVVHLKDIQKRATNVKACGGAMVLVPTSINNNIDAVFDKLPSAQHLKIVVHSSWDKSYIVCMEKVIQALRWLKENNAEYKDIVIDKHFSFVKNENVFFENDSAHNVEQLVRRENSSDGVLLKFKETIQPLQKVNQPPGTTLDPLTQFELIKLPYKPMHKEEKKGDIWAFTHLFPNGKFGMYDENRLIKLQPSQYLRSILLNENRRISSDMYWLAYQYANKIQKEIASCQGVQSRCNRNDMKTLIDKRDPSFVQSMSSVFNKVRGFRQYWHLIRNRLSFHVGLFGAPTWFLTLNPSERNWTDLFEIYTRVARSPVNDQNIRDHISRDPVPWSRYWQKRVKAFFKNIVLNNEGPFGEVIHYFTRVEYQHRGSQHVHCLLWAKNRPSPDATDSDIRKFIDEVVTARLPTDNEKMLKELVTNHQMHHPSHNPTCIRYRKVRGRLFKQCRFHFPRPVTPRTIVYSEEERNGRRCYDVGRKQDEVFINDYNPSVLLCWKGNMDIQFVGNDKNVLSYVTAYATKGEIAKKLDAVSNEDQYVSVSNAIYSLGIDELNSREVGGPEMVDEILGHSNFSFDIAESWIPTDPSSNRTRMLNSKRDMENTGDVFTTNLLDSYYPNRPKELEHYCLYNLATNYRCSGKAQQYNSDSTRVFANAFPEYNTEDAYSPMFDHQNFKGSKTLKIDGCTKFFIRKKQTVGRFHIPILDDNNPHSTEDFYRRLCLLFVPWRSEDDMLSESGSDTYYELFHEHLSYMEQAHPKAYTDLVKCLNVYKNMDEDRKNARVKAQNLKAALSECEFVETEELQIKAIIVNIEDHEANKKKLNDEQRQLFERIMDHIERGEKGTFESLKLFVSGTAGVGKSFVINCVANELELKYGRPDDAFSQPAVLLTAPTGLAAVSIGGITLHSLLGLTVKEGGEAYYEALSPEERDKRRQLFRNVKLIVIDEVSMIGSIALAKISNRLKEIGDPTKEFGGFNVLMFGDLLQLTPVRQLPAYRGLSEHTARRYFGGKQGANLWHLFRFFELKCNMRQSGDEQCASMLERIRTNCVSADDITLLRTRLISGDDCTIRTAAEHYLQLSKQDPRVMTLMPTLKQVKEFNDEVTRQLGCETIDLIAKDTATGGSKKDNGRRQVKSRPWQRSEYDLSTTANKKDPLQVSTMQNVAAGLQAKVQIFKNARVILIRNINKVEGLMNGLTGIIEQINMDDKNEVKSVDIRFDRYPHKLHTITRYSAPYTTKSGERRMRNQFPIEVAFAVSIHKSQGMTLDNVLISSEGIFAEAQFYVAASRVRSLNGLHLIDLKTSVIKVDLKALEEYDRLRKSCMDDFLGKEKECGAADVPMDDDMIGKDHSFGSFIENRDTGMDVDAFHDSVIQHNLCPLLLENVDNDCFLNTLLNIMNTCQTFKQQMIRERSDSAIHEQMAKLFNRETSQARDFRFWFLDENLREGQQDINNALDDIIENIPVDSLTSFQVIESLYWHCEMCGRRSDVERNVASMKLVMHSSGTLAQLLQNPQSERSCKCGLKEYHLRSFDVTPSTDNIIIQLLKSGPKCYLDDLNDQLHISIGQAQWIVTAFAEYVPTYGTKYATNGHYVAWIRSGSDWIRVSDDVATTHPTLYSPNLDVTTLILKKIT